MKTKIIFIALAFLFLIGAAMAQTNCIFGYVSDFSTVPLSTKTSVTFSLLSPNPRWNGNTLVSQAAKTVKVDITTGKFSVTNLLSGYYGMTLNDGSGTENRFWVWPTTLGSVPIGSLTDNSYIQPITPPNPPIFKFRCGRRIGTRPHSPTEKAIGNTQSCPWDGSTQRRHSSGS